MQIDASIDLISLIGLSCTAIGLFLSLFYLSFNRFKEDGYRYLYLIILFLALELAFKTFIHSRLFYSFPSFYLPGRYYNLILYPCFLIFFWNMNKNAGKLQKWSYILFLPFLLYWLIYRFPLLSESLDQKMQWMNAFYADRRPGPFNYWKSKDTIFKVLIIPLAFLIAIARQYLFFIKNHKSKADKTLLRLLGAVILFYFLYTLGVNQLYQYLYKITGYSLIEWPIDICFLSLILLILSLLIQLANIGSPLLPSPKYQSSTLKEMEAQKIFQQVIELIEKEQLFLEPDLKIDKIAAQLQRNKKYISQAINQMKGQSFTQLINEYRVAYAKEKLEDLAHNKYTIEAIGTQSGFRSKSTFFSTFKKITGMTPHNYQKSIQKEF